MPQALEHVKRSIVLKRSTGTIELLEPYPGASMEQIRAFNANEYPELVTCGVDVTTEEVTFKPDNGPEVRTTRENVTYKPQAGTRG